MWRRWRHRECRWKFIPLRYLRFAVSKNMKQRVYRYDSVWDGFTYSLVLGVIAFAIILNIVIPGWITFLCVIPVVLIVIIGITGCWYEICGDRLIVHDFVRVKSFPIDKIASIEPTKSWLSAPAPSLFHRIEIKFTSRDVLEDSMLMMPGNSLIISPAHIENFYRQLLDINPNIKIS